MIGPQIRRSAAMTANGTSQPLQEAPAWQHRFPATDAIMEFTLNGSDANMEFEITSGSEVLIQRSPVPGGGTAGTFLAFQENKGAVGVYAGQEVAVTIFETAGGTPSYNLEVHLTPV